MFQFLHHLPQALLHLQVVVGEILLPDVLRHQLQGFQPAAQVRLGQIHLPPAALGHHVAGGKGPVGAGGLLPGSEGLGHLHHHQGGEECHRQQHRAGRQVLGMLHSLVALAGHPIGKRLYSRIERLCRESAADTQRNRHPFHGGKPKPPTAARDSYRRHDMDARIVLATQQPHNARKGIRKTFRPFLPTEFFCLFHIANLHIFSLFSPSPYK